MRQCIIIAVAAMAVALYVSPAVASDSLYRDLGERPGITVIIDDTMGYVLKDDRIKHEFDDTNISRLKGLLVDFIEQMSGGPQIYKGQSMKAAHKGLNLKNADFNALVEDMQKGMDDAHIPFATQNRLLAILAPMQRDVVTK